jgi:transposase
MKHATPRTSITAMPLTPITIGLDMGNRSSSYCIIDDGCRHLEDGKVAMTREALSALLSRFAPARLVVEAGGHSPWVSRLGAELGCGVIVANPRRVKLISCNDRKSDRTDAEFLARLGRLDPELLSPVKHRSVKRQAALATKRARDMAVDSRTALVNHVRGAVKSFGHRIPMCSTSCFHDRAKEHLPDELRSALLPILRLIGELSVEIKQFDTHIERMADEGFPETRALRQVPGVGPLIALSYVLTLGSPSRIDDSRQAGPFLGLVPRRHDSGDSSPQLRISKAGDHDMRRLLVIAANYILGHFGPDCDLKRFGLRLASSGGKNGRKRAKTAVARKLAVLLHHLWKTGEVYDPFHLAKRRGEALPA